MRLKIEVSIFYKNFLKKFLKSGNFYASRIYILWISNIPLKFKSTRKSWLYISSSSLSGRTISVQEKCGFKSHLDDQGLCVLLPPMKDYGPLYINYGNMEGWSRGLRQLFAKQSGIDLPHRFESCTFRQ